MPKTCDKCEAEFKGFGTTCSACRLGKERQIHSCVKCGAVFNGRSTVCDLCGGKAVAVGGTQVSALARGRIIDAKDQTECFKCGQPFGAGGEAMIFENNRYHERCLTCESCDKVLNAGEVFRVEGQLVCSSCLPKNVCAGCHQPVSGVVTKVNGKQYHPDCFKCEECGEKLVGGFAKVGNQSLCRGCATKKLAKGTCVVCEQLITGACVKAQKGDLFHRECFKCFDCQEPLKSYVKDESRQFKYQKATYLCNPCAEKRAQAEEEEDDMPCHICGTRYPKGQFWCVKCDSPCYKVDESNKTCCICKEEITGPGAYQLADGSVFHLDCFRCGHCGDLAVDEAALKERKVRLLNSQVDAAIRGEYFCPECIARREQQQQLAPVID